MNTASHAAATDFNGQTRIQILNSFGYIVLDRAPYFVAMIKSDPEAFTVVCLSQDEAEREAYEQLRAEVDPDLGYVFPDFA